jgi:RNA polymerase sigma-70 factor (ECF subfamily)
MADQEWLAEKFEENRGHLRAVAYRMLGSATEADDAVQESWLRLSRTDAGEIENLSGWLTTVVARVSLDMLRSRTSRREEAIDEKVAEPVAVRGAGHDPEQEALLADSVGIALLVVLNRLTPSERLAFVLHDMFGLSFEEIGEIAGRTPEAARQLASRARRRVQGADTISSADRKQQREIVSAFLTALRAGDFEGLVAVLDPDVIVRFDEAAMRPGGPREIRGARNWAKGTVEFSRMAGMVEPMLVNGAVGLVWAPAGKLARALTFVMRDGRIAEVDIIGEATQLGELEIAVLDSLIPDFPRRV